MLVVRHHVIAPRVPGLPDRSRMVLTLSDSGLQAPGKSRADEKSEVSPWHGPMLRVWVPGWAGIILTKAVTPPAVLLWVIQRRRRRTLTPWHDSHVHHSWDSNSY